MTDLPDADDAGDAEHPLRPGLRIHPPEIWDLARRDYLAGHSGPAVCARYGLGLTSFRNRAASGGWRRVDQPAPIPAAPIEVDGNLDEAGYFDLAEMAAIHLREAIVNGRATEAATWLRIHLRLHEASAAEDAALRAERGNEEMDGLDGLDGVFSGPESVLSPGTRPHPETPAPPASSPAPGPGCDAESGRSGR